MTSLSKLCQSASKALLGRSIGRYWHSWERSGGFHGSTETIFLCAAMSEKVSGEDWYPGPLALGPALGAFRISEDAQGRLISWSLELSKKIDRTAALDLLFENYPWAERIKNYPELEG